MSLRLLGCASRLPQRLLRDSSALLYPTSAKLLKGYKGAGVLEVADDYDGDTYRCVYTVRFEDAIYVLHAFQKKSHQGISTPEKELRVVEARLKEVEQIHRKRM